MVVPLLVIVIAFRRPCPKPIWMLASSGTISEVTLITVLLVMLSKTVDSEEHGHCPSTQHVVLSEPPVVLMVITLL